MTLPPNNVGVPLTRQRPIRTRVGTREFRDALIVNGTMPFPEYHQEDAYLFGGTQITVSEGHPFLGSKRKGREDIGGEFFTRTQEVFVADPVHYEESLLLSPGVYRRIIYDGPVMSVDPTGGYGSLPFALSSTKEELENLGTRAIARVSPTNPVANLTTALAELQRDGLPHLGPAETLWQDGVSKSRNAGDEYLNVQFGWLPLIRDISDFGKGVTKAPDLIDQYRRDIGKNVRRRYDFPTLRESTSEVFTGQRPAWMSPIWWNADGTLTREIDVTRTRWFKGCFSYYFPSDILGSRRLADLAILSKRLGLEVTPEVVWNVAPWSWAVDWFSSTGDVITNWSRFHNDGLVLRWGYMMETSIVNVTYTLSDCTGFSPHMPPVSPVIFRITTKQRVKANPYGFGVSWDGLSAFQASILAALGISRGRR